MGHSKTYVVILALLAMLGTSWAGQANKALMDTPKNKSQDSLPKEEVDEQEPRLGNNEYREAIVAFINEIDKTYPFF